MVSQQDRDTKRMLAEPKACWLNRFPGRVLSRTGFLDYKTIVHWASRSSKNASRPCPAWERRSASQAGKEGPSNEDAAVQEECMQACVQSCMKTPLNGCVER